jgi:NTP pyrophosphatase (non-canonical NTP hydrolase)
MALANEAGELLEVFQWLTPEQSLTIMDEPAGAERVAEEVADVFAYLLQLCDVLGIDLERAVLDKIQENAGSTRSRRLVAARSSTPAWAGRASYDLRRPPAARPEGQLRQNGRATRAVR